MIRDLCLNCWRSFRVITLVRGSLTQAYTISTWLCLIPTIYIHIYIYTYICIYIYNLFRVQDVICINAKPTWFIPTKSQWWDFIPIHLYVVPQVLDSLSSCHSTVFFPFIESHWACLFRRNHFHYWFIGHIQIHGDEIPTLKLAAKYHQLHLPYLFLWADVPPLEPFKIGYIPRYPQYIPRKWSVNPHHVFAIGSKNERVVVHILHIAVLVLVSSQLFAVRWGEVRWGGLFTLMFTRSRGGCCVANIFSWGVAWGGMGCYLQFALPHTHTSCYAAVRFLALPHRRHATLLYVRLHFHADVMLGCCTFSCTSTRTSSIKIYHIYPRRGFKFAEDVRTHDWSMTKWRKEKRCDTPRLICQKV